MCCSYRTGLSRLWWTVPCVLMLGCLGPGGGSQDQVSTQEYLRAHVSASDSSERASRRAYAGAPPVIPHEDFSRDCQSCHGAREIAVLGMGVSPPSPHGKTAGMSAARCEQCHVPQTVSELLVKTTFEGHARSLNAGSRAHELAPPRIPHRVFMREDCLACHSGGSAREAIRTTHPERARCLQCHVPIGTPTFFN